MIKQLVFYKYESQLATVSGVKLRQPGDAKAEFSRRLARFQCGEIETLLVHVSDMNAGWRVTIAEGKSLTTFCGTDWTMYEVLCGLTRIREVEIAEAL